MREDYYRKYAVKITCSNITDFLENLSAVDNVHRRTVHYDRTSRELSEFSSEVFLQVSAIIEFADDTQALLEAGVNCGVDRRSADGDLDGSGVQEELMKNIAGYCEANKLKLLPGILDA